MSSLPEPVSSREVPRGREITIISHSSLFYWWPVWFIGFIMAFLTYWGDHRMAIVPTGTQAVLDGTIEGFEGTRDILVVPEGKQLPRDRQTGAPLEPDLLMATSKNLGGLFLLILFLVIIVTNVPLRGLWSVTIILLIVVTALVLALLDWWDDVLRYFGLVQIYINAYGYFLLSFSLFIAWVLATFLFDRRIYMVFSPGQFRVHMEIGEGEIAFDTQGMAVHKQRNDLFRHWILGMGSGDLIVQTGGAHPQTFEMPNVLFVGSKVKVIEQMLQEREVIEGQMKAYPR